MESFDRLSGSLLAGALGDAMGGSFEGRQASDIPQRPSKHFSPERPRFSDDTQLTLATCAAVARANGEVRPEEIAIEFRDRFRAGEFTGLGASTAKALRDLDAGGHWALVGRKGDRSAGNGAAMRVAPLGFLLDPNDEKQRRLLRDVCRITHHNEEAYCGALAIVVAIHLIRTGKWNAEPTVLETVAALLPDSVTRDRLWEMSRVTGLTVTEAASRFGATGYVADTVPLALLGVSTIAGNDMLDRMDEVIRCGGDTDTNAAVFGNLAGALLGISKLPEFVVKIDVHGRIVSAAQSLRPFIVG